MSDPRIERKIIMAMITSRDFLQQIRPIYSPRLMQSSVAKRISRWCADYFDRHQDAPGINIETIYLTKIKEDKLPDELAEEIEEDILPGLSSEFINNPPNIPYLIEQTRNYFRERGLLEYARTIQTLLDQGEGLEAEKLASEYRPIARELGSGLDLGTEQALERIEQAFNSQMESVVTFPGALGEFWNDQMVRGGFIGLMAPEKRGKTFWLMEIAMRASRQGRSVAFFQAGDMTEGQQLRRICIYRAKKSDSEKYCGDRMIPVKDCIHNQTDECDREERECDHGIWDKEDLLEMAGKVRYKVTQEKLLEKWKENPDYKPCHNCQEFKHRQWGTPWIKKIHIAQPLDIKEAQKAFQSFFIDKKRQFKLSTHANNTLSISEMKALLDIWQRQDDFIPDLIVVDYADILIDTGKEFRHSQNEIWKGLRGLSQSRHALVVTATQADANSYERDRLGLKNFSEDKRKYGHVTAMYGLNQDHDGREKKLGLMRINELVIREGFFDTNKEVRVLQSLQTGQPFLTSYW